MTFQRIVRYGDEPEALAEVLTDEAITGGWFELHRQGGCGAGELRLALSFAERRRLEVGQWVALEYVPGERWYLGRVEEIAVAYPAGMVVQLQGMGVELGEVYPGGFSLEGDGRKPHRYGLSDLFPEDPDYDAESVDPVGVVRDVVRKLAEQYVAPATRIQVDAARIESPAEAKPVSSAKFNGEESVRSILKDLAVRAGHGPWGVDESGEFFFTLPRTSVGATWRLGRDVSRCEERSERGLIYNRMLLTGGYVYDPPAVSDEIHRVSRWRGNYRQPASIAQFGERRIRLWTPWIRTQRDALAFVRSFFVRYAHGARRYSVEIPAVNELFRPWEGWVRLEDTDGSELVTGEVSSLRVQFDRSPRMSVEIGPEDPQVLWASAPYDERWPIGPRSRNGQGGDEVTLSGEGGGGGGGGNGDTSTNSYGDEETSWLPTSSELFSGTWSTAAWTSEWLTSEEWTSEELTSDEETSELTSEEGSDDETSHTTSHDSSGAGGGSESGAFSVTELETSLTEDSDLTSEDDESDGSMETGGTGTNSTAWPDPTEGGGTSGEDSELTDSDDRTSSGAETSE